MNPDPKPCTEGYRYPEYRLRSAWIVIRVVPVLKLQLKKFRKITLGFITSELVFGQHPLRLELVLADVTNDHLREVVDLDYRILLPLS
jgi:hypothetical protein